LTDNKFKQLEYYKHVENRYVCISCHNFDTTSKKEINKHITLVHNVRQLKPEQVLVHGVVTETWHLGMYLRRLLPKGENLDEGIKYLTIIEDLVHKYEESLSL
jgi:hypothetical protein